jgi:hypothetical protein
LIDANEAEKALLQLRKGYRKAEEICAVGGCILEIRDAPTVDAVEVVHGRWVLKAHEENANYRWNVTAECSECHHSKGEVYAGFFPGFPKDLAREVVLDSAKIVKLDNFCPNCGAKMDGERKDGE